MEYVRISRTAAEMCLFHLKKKKLQFMIPFVANPIEKVWIDAWLEILSLLFNPNRERNQRQKQSTNKFFDWKEYRNDSSVQLFEKFFFSNVLKPWSTWKTNKYFKPEPQEMILEWRVCNNADAHVTHDDFQCICKKTAHYCLYSSYEYKHKAQN